jgi:hypothetical protein
MRHAWRAVRNLRERYTLLAGSGLFVLIVGLSSCAVPIHSDSMTTHYVIVGFGIVTVHENARDAIVATDAQSLGLIVTSRPDFHASAGYMSSAVVSVPDGAEDARVDISRRPFGPLVVRTTSAKLTQAGGEKK